MGKFWMFCVDTETDSCHKQNARQGQGLNPMKVTCSLQPASTGLRSFTLTARDPSEREPLN